MYGLCLHAMFSTHHTGQCEVVAGGVRGCGQCAGGGERFKTHCAVVTLLDIEVCFQPDRNTLRGGEGCMDEK